MDYSVDLEIPGFKEILKGFKKKLTCWINLPFYFLAHLPLLDWAYRFFLKGNTNRMELKKKISIFEDIMERTTLTFS